MADIVKRLRECETGCSDGNCYNEDLMASAADEIERLRNALKDARDKLKIYYDRSDKNYEGGVPYDVLVAQINMLVDQ